MTDDLMWRMQVVKYVSFSHLSPFDMEPLSTLYIQFKRQLQHNNSKIPWFRWLVQILPSQVSSTLMLSYCRQCQSQDGGVLIRSDHETGRLVLELLSVSRMHGRLVHHHVLTQLVEYDSQVPSS